MYKKIKSIFFSGLVAFLPIAITLYIVVTGVQIIDNFLGQYLRSWFLDEYYFLGLGFLTAVVLIMLLGFLLNNFLTGTVLARLQERLTEVPLIKIIYSPLRDLMNLFSKGQQSAMKKVVLIRLADNITALGLVTREDFSDLKLNFKIAPDRIAVFIPYSYGLGGITILTTKQSIEPIDIPVEKAMSLAITGWIKTDASETKTTAVMATEQMKTSSGQEL
jgi:uncharacterized membrane protein